MAEAMRLIQLHSRRLSVTTRRVDASLRGHVLAEDIVSTHEIPLHPSTNVDGYAVRG